MTATLGRIPKPKWFESDETPPLVLGPELTATLLRDPKHLAFTLARYKFVAKLLQGKTRVLEVGCGEGLGTLTVAREVGSLVAVDRYAPHVEGCRERYSVPNLTFTQHDIITLPVWWPDPFDAAYSLDVIEHIEPRETWTFLHHIAESLSDDGVFILGSPSAESQQYASDASRSEHVNCRSGDEWRSLLGTHFRHVFLFGMNDEIVHTGYLPMAHYVLALCVGPKR